MKDGAGRAVAFAGVLVLVLLGAAGCAGPVVRSEVMQTGAAPLTTLSFKAERNRFTGVPTGNTRQADDWNLLMSNFGDVLANTLNEGLPKRLAANGVAVVDAGDEVSHLRIAADGYRINCGGGGGCAAVLVMAGAVTGPGTVQRWRFESPLSFEGFNQESYDAFEAEVVAQLIRDRVIAGPTAVNP